MTLGFPSLRVDPTNPLHRLWCNNGTWWVHYTLHFGGRKRRIRRSLATRAVDVAVRRRDELLARLANEGELVPEGRTRREVSVGPVLLVAPPRLSLTTCCGSQLICRRSGGSGLPMPRRRTFLDAVASSAHSMPASLRHPGCGSLETPATVHGPTLPAFVARLRLPGDARGSSMTRTEGAVDPSPGR